MIEISASSEIGALRIVNEDRVLADAASGLAGVFDGCGGVSEAGALAQLVLETVRRCLVVAEEVARDALL